MLDLLARLRQARLQDLALSVYLPPGPALDRRYYQAALKDLEKGQSGLDKDARCALGRELTRARSYLEQYHPSGKPLCIFSCEPAGLFEAGHLPRDVGARLTLAPQLDLGPLLEIAREHPPALVVVADKARARVFTVTLGECEEVADLEGDPVRRHRQGGWSDRRLQRHEDELAHGNLKAAVEWIESFAPRSARLYVAGPPEARSGFKHLLPKRLHQNLAGEFAANLAITPAQLLNRLKAAG